MTINFMITLLEDGHMMYGEDDDHVLLTVKQANAIATALRAGRAMRDQLKVNYYADDQNKPWAVIEMHGNSFALGKGCKAWDAAVGEKE